MEVLTRSGKEVLCLPMAASLVMSIGRLHSLIAAFLLCVGVTARADELRTTKITVPLADEF